MSTTPTESDPHARIALLEKEKGDALELIASLRKKIYALEEENDLLALDNERLKAIPSTTPDPNDDDLPPPPPTIGIFNLPVNNSYLEEGDGESLATKQAYLLEGVGGGLNPLCVHVCSFPPSLPPSLSASVLIAVGGVDKFLTLYRVQEGSPSEKVLVLSGFGGPLLSVDFKVVDEKE
ncbi:hypothetical protein VYU27_009271, partial [Nannochloropsis oceanica]